MRKNKKEREITVEIEWKQLQAIAEHWGFPTAVYFAPLEYIENQEHTHSEIVGKIVQKFWEIAKIVHECEDFIYEEKTEKKNKRKKN